MNNDDRRRRIQALTATVLTVGLILIALLTARLRYNGDEPRVWPPVDSAELLLAGEYVMAGDIPQPELTDPQPAPEAAEQPAPEADDLKDSGEPAPETAPVVSSEQESPMKTKRKPKPEKTGPTQAELEEQERVKKQKEAADRINSRVSFGGTKKGSSQAKGSSGSPNGNASSGALSGTPGTNLKGRTLSSWEKPAGTQTGTITVTVRVNRQGHVVAASYATGTGPVASQPAARRSCEQAAMRSRFSVDLDAVSEQTGTITYRFE